MFHIIAINEKTGERTQVTAAPMTHDEACTMVGKFGYHASRRMVVEPVSDQSHTYSDFRVLQTAFLEVSNHATAQYEMIGQQAEKIGDLEDKVSDLRKANDSIRQQRDKAIVLIERQSNPDRTIPRLARERDEATRAMIEANTRAVEHVGRIETLRQALMTVESMVASAKTPKEILKYIAHALAS